MISTADLERARDIAAEIVSAHGEKYLPVFLRIEAELEKRAAQVGALERARSIAKAAQGR